MPMSTQIGGFTQKVQATPTITAASAYASGNVIGGLLTLAGALRSGGPGSGAVVSLLLTDKAAQKAAIDVLFFTALPTSTFTDKTALAVAAADLPNYAGRVSIGTGDYTNLAASTNAEATKANVGLALAGAASNTTLWAVLVSRGTPTYASTTDLALTALFSGD